MTTRRMASVALGLAWLTVAAPAFAQGTGRSMDIDASVRSSGMGGASGAVFWGGDANFWANPALLGYHDGIHYLWNRTQLVPGLADDVIFSSNRVTLGWAGLGLAIGSIHLSYGQSEGRDENGNPTGTFESHEDIDVMGAGFSLSRLAAAFAGDDGAGAFDYFDVAAGIASKQVEIALAPGFPGGTSTANPHDWGTVVRVSPLPHARAPETGGIFLDVSYGHAVLNFDDETFVFLNEDLASPPSRIHRNGVAARAGLLNPSPPDPDARWARGFEPLLSVGFALDQEHITAGSLGGGYDVDRWGVEAAVFNAVTLRVGHVTDRLGDIDGASFGFGLGLPISDFAGVRYDFASVPQASGLDETVKRHAVTAWLDPMRLAASVSGRGGWAMR